MLSKMKAGDPTTVSEALDTCFHFFHYEYPSTKCLLKQSSFQVIIQKGKNEEKKMHSQVKLYCMHLHVYLRKISLG